MPDLRVGVIGLGNMGRPIARICCAPGFRPPSSTSGRRLWTPFGMRGSSGLVPRSGRSTIRDSLPRRARLQRRSAGALWEERRGTRGGEGQRGRRHDDGRPARLQTLRRPPRETGNCLPRLPHDRRGDGSESWRLLLMVGGDRGVYERCLPVFGRISKRAIHVGRSAAAT